MIVCAVSPKIMPATPSDNVIRPTSRPDWRVRTVRPPIRMSDTPATIRRGAPVLGTDTRSILTELGYSDERIEQLLISNAVGATVTAAA